MGNLVIYSHKQPGIQIQLNQPFPTWLNLKITQADGAVTSDDKAHSNGAQSSTITVTPSQDTTYVCKVTDANTDATVDTTLTLNVFGKSVGVYHCTIQNFLLAQDVKN